MKQKKKKRRSDDWEGLFGKNGLVLSPWQQKTGREPRLKSGQPLAERNFAGSAGGILPATIGCFLSWLLLLEKFEIHALPIVRLLCSERGSNS